MSIKRISVGLLSLSAAALIGIAADESYTTEAVIPTKGDVPTLGFGSTFHADGTPVKMGEKTTPVRALILLQAHVSKEEAIVRKGLAGAELSQAEWDLYMDFVYQYGTTNWYSSSMRREILAKNYTGACNALLGWKKAAGYDCSTPGNTRCMGVWTRQLKRHATCMAAQ